MRKNERRCQKKRTKSVAQILTKTTMTTWTIISTATQLICLDIEHGRSENEEESSNLHSVKHTPKKNETKRNITNK